MLFINFNFTYTPVHYLSRRARLRSTNSRISLIIAPVYDQDTTQIAEYDGGMYITPALLHCLINTPLILSWFKSVFNSIDQGIKRELLQMWFLCNIL